MGTATGQSAPKAIKCISSDACSESFEEYLLERALPVDVWRWYKVAVAKHAVVSVCAELVYIKCICKYAMSCRYACCVFTFFCRSFGHPSNRQYTMSHFYKHTHTHICRDHFFRFFLLAFNRYYNTPHLHTTHTHTQAAFLHVCFRFFGTHR